MQTTVRGEEKRKFARRGAVIDVSIHPSGAILTTRRKEGRRKKKEEERNEEGSD